jgi:hypothetical protein
LLIGTLGVLCGAGCSGSLGAPPSDGVRDAAGPNRSIDAGSPTDGARDALVEAGAACGPLTASPKTWSDVLAATPMCFGTIAGPVSFEFRLNCGAYDLDVFRLGDTTGTYFYDATTGALVAVVTKASGKTACQSSLDGGVVPVNCADSSTPSLCEWRDGGVVPIPDAGTDQSDAGG